MSQTDLMSLTQDAYNSEDYKIALKYSSTSSERHVVVVEGLD